MNQLLVRFDDVNNNISIAANKLTKSAPIDRDGDVRTVDKKKINSFNLIQFRQILCGSFCMVSFYSFANHNGVPPSAHFCQWYHIYVDRHSFMASDFHAEVLYINIYSPYIWCLIQHQQYHFVRVARERPCSETYARPFIDTKTFETKIHCYYYYVDCAVCCWLQCGMHWHKVLERMFTFTERQRMGKGHGIKLNIVDEKG